MRAVSQFSAYFFRPKTQGICILLAMVALFLVLYFGYATSSTTPKALEPSASPKAGNSQDASSNEADGGDVNDGISDEIESFGNGVSDSGGEWLGIVVGDIYATIGGGEMGTQRPSPASVGTAADARTLPTTLLRISEQGPGDVVISALHNDGEDQQQPDQADHVR